jgi:superfamily I DNA/RNA helicase
VASDFGEDDLLVLDRKQEALAKSLGVGHRVIRGAAGSGKTLVLTYQARLLAETFPRQRVLVTCYTRSLAGRLRSQLRPWKNITVSNLNTLMTKARRAADVEVADYAKYSREELSELALRALDLRPDAVSHFHHVLIDEAQDFPTPALQFAVSLLVGGSDSLLAVADPVQNIFETKFTWKAAGIKAAGRTRWLDQSYRNTREILEYAHRFVMAGGGFEIASDPDPENQTTISAPQFSPRSGPLPLILSAPSRQGKVLSLAKHCRSLIDRRVEPGDIAILYGVTWTGNFNWPKLSEQCSLRSRSRFSWPMTAIKETTLAKIGQGSSCARSPHQRAWNSDTCSFAATLMIGPRNNQRSAGP